MEVILSRNQTIKNLTEKERDKLKEILTFKNPKYANALRFARNPSYITIPPYLFFYEERKGEFSCPIGVNLDKYFNNIKYADCRRKNEVPYPNFLLTLTNTQKEAAGFYLREQKEFRPRNIIQLPTGKGKTILALYLAYALKQKTLILVGKDDLVVGWNKDIQLCFGKMETGLIKAKKRKVGNQFTIATIQTLNRMSEEELNNYINEFGFVVQDEVHHLNAGWFNIIDKFSAKYKLGLSATPFRTDKCDYVFDIYFNGIGYKYLARKEDEDICNVEVSLIESNYKLKPFLYKKQIFNAYDFKDIPDESEYLEDLPYKERPKIPFLVIDNDCVLSLKTKIKVCKEIIREYREGRSILVLFTQKEHILAYKRYLEFFIPSKEIMLYYGDSKESSKVMIEKAESRQVKVTLGTLAKTTEGTNVKAWEVLFLVSSINNRKNIEQAAGRIRRKCGGKIEPVKLYDVIYPECYSIKNHFNTRLAAYKSLLFTLNFNIKERSIFSRGYNKR